MVKALKTVLTFIAGVGVIIFGGFFVCANEAKNLVILGGAIMFIGGAIVVLSGIFERKRKLKRKPY